VNPDDENTQFQLGEISARQGLLVDAKSYFNAVVAKRRARGDRAGTAEIVIRLGGLDPADIEARMAAAGMVAEMGDETLAAIRFREIHDDLQEKGRTDEALAALRESVRFNPYDNEGRGILARAAVAAGDLEAARGYLDRETAGSDPALLVALAEIELRLGRIDEGREILPQLLAIDREMRAKLLDLSWSLTAVNQDAAFASAEAVTDDYVARSEFDDAAAVLHEFATRVPRHVPALLKLIEISVDGGLQTMMHEAQVQLADAYLECDQPLEARVIAEDLVAREPWEKAHIERFRRALVMLRVPDPDILIAERLNGQAPFMATDPFIDLNEPGALTPAPHDESVETEAAASPEPPAPMPEREAPAPEPVAEPEPPAIQAAAAAPVKPVRVRKSKPVAAPTSMGGEIDLTSALGGLSDDTDEPSGKAPGDLDEVFQDFRHEVSKQSGADQSEQHMTIARAYLDMGLTDEAIPALTTAAKSPRLRFEAASALGRLHNERGESGAAIEWLERAAEAPAPSVDEGRALLYDLARTLEDAGETARALAVFLELQAEGADYRDVAARAERLAGMSGG
jgi:tetratricopeptide (TPR) repeat protein